MVKALIVLRITDARSTSNCRQTNSGITRGTITLNSAANLLLIVDKAVEKISIDGGGNSFLSTERIELSIVGYKVVNPHGQFYDGRKIEPLSRSKTRSINR